MSGEPSPGRMTWRDVYQLVRDTREDVLESLATVNDKVDQVVDRVDAIESAAARSAGRTAGRLDAITATRTFVVTVVAVANGIVALVLVFLRG